MDLNKCKRCGCFFTLDSAVCPNCESKDNNEISKLKNFLLGDNTIEASVEELSANTGISIQNLTRHLENKDLKPLKKQLGNTENGNISISF